VIIVGLIVNSIRIHYEIKRAGGIRGIIVNIAKEIIEIKHEIEKDGK